MFNQKTKSVRIKGDATPPAQPPTTLTSPVADSKASKGLLSFNTSNFTKLFKNSSNFVQTTFGGAATAATAATCNGLTQLPSPEQSFTIPSYKRAPTASSHAPAKKDILSTPVLIAPTIPSTSASTLVSSLSASSTAAVALNPASLSNGNVAAAFVQFRSAAHDIKSVTANSHKLASSPITSTSGSGGASKALPSDSSSMKNYNLFETVKVGKSTPSPPSTSSVIVKQPPHKLDTFASQQRPDYHIDSKENRNGSATANTFACQKQLDNFTNLSRLKNGNLSTNDPAPKPSAVVSDALLPLAHNTTTAAAAAKTTMIVDMYGMAATPVPDNEASGKVMNSYPTTNGTPNGGPSYNGSSPSSSSSSTNSSSSNSNNNLDFNVQECMEQMLAADCPFDKLNYLQQMNNNPSSSFDAFKMSASAHKSMENIYENCARTADAQRVDDNCGRGRDAAANYYQQDSNENIVSTKSSAIASTGGAIVASANNNNSKSNAHTISGTAQNSAQKSNNNNISSSSSGSSNYNQIFFVTNTTELHDIQEIDDDDDEDNANGIDDDTRNDDENAFVSRYCGNWSSAKNPALAKHHKNYVPPSAMSSASFAAAAAAMNDFKTTNRNPFLQLMEPTPSTSSSAIVAPSMGASLFFGDGHASATTGSSENNNIAFGINEPIKLFDSLASLAIVAASMTHENNGENDAIDVCLGKLVGAEMKMANGQVAHSTTATIDGSTIVSDAMKTLRSLLEERDGNNYIKQFLQVILRQTK